MRRTAVLRALGCAPAIVALAPSGAPAQSTPVTIRYLSAPSDDQMPVLYAQKAGMFEQAGLNVIATRAATGATVAQAVVGGAIDIGKGSLSSLIAAHARAIPFELIAPAAIHREESSVNSAIIVAANSPIRSVMDLQGKTVSCTAIGDIGYLGTRAMIDNAGGDSSTMKWVEIPISAVTVALDQGRIDGGVTVEPYMTKDLSTGKVRVLVDMLNGYKHPILEGAYFAMHEYIVAHADAVARFARVLVQAAVYTNGHTTETIPLLVAYTGMDPDTATRMHHAVIGTTFDAADIQPIIDLAAKYKIIPNRFDAHEMMAILPRR